MQLLKDNQVGYRIDTLSGTELEQLRETIATQYQDERKQLTEKEFNEQVNDTLASILGRKHTAWIDIWEDDAILHIEPDYGFGSIDIIINGVVV